MSYSSNQHTPTSGTWVLALFGALAVAGLLTAMVWVVEGQMQQAKVLRAQWQSAPRMAQGARFDVERDSTSSRAAASVRTASVNSGSITTVSNVGNGIIAASFDRP